MRILHVITTLDVGGAERLMVDLLPELIHRSNEVDLLLFNGINTAFKDDLSSKGINVFELSNEDGYLDHHEVYNPLNIIRLLKYVSDYDIIHTHNTACQFYVAIAAAIKRSKSVLVTTEHSSNNRRRSSFWFKPFDKWMYSRYSKIICIADQTRENLESYIGNRRSICTICNGVDTNRFINPIKDISHQDKFVITMVAGLRKEKDHETVFKSMLRLPNNFTLQVVGNGETEQSLKEKCHEMGLDNRIHFLGARMDIPAILRDSDINLLSSHWEGLSLSSIEGMASGRPFIASDVDGLRDVVGGAGVLFPHGDDKALAKCVNDLCDNPSYYHDVAVSCQKRAMEYDISVMADKYNDLYKSLINMASAR